MEDGQYVIALYLIEAHSSGQSGSYKRTHTRNTGTASVNFSESLGRAGLVQKRQGPGTDGLALEERGPGISTRGDCSLLPGQSSTECAFKNFIFIAVLEEHHKTMLEGRAGCFLIHVAPDARNTPQKGGLSEDFLDPLCSPREEWETGSSCPGLS